ncbi:MAG: deoxyribose-phosphate aldolase [Pirellulaceae bacterium]
MTKQPVERLIDHALLHPTMTDDEIRAGCELAKRLNLKSVCVKPYSIPLAVSVLRDSETLVGTVIGFPHGSSPTEIKVAESNWAMDHGATELDMVVNIGKAKQGDWKFVSQDIAAVVNAAHSRNVIVKVIFETDYLTDTATKQKLCEICEQVGADFVKTSTGFGFVKVASGDYNYVGATEQDIELMRKSCSDKVGVKASGGVRDFEQASRLVELGASRLGTSASEAIVNRSGKDAKSY